MRLRTALTWSAFLLVVFTIAVWSTPLPAHERLVGTSR
jgi:hypothetical protein